MHRPLRPGADLGESGARGSTRQFPGAAVWRRAAAGAIARALAKKPKLLLCDEPTGALDYETGKEVLQLLQDICRTERMTVLIVTHNSALAPMAHKVIRFRSGKVTSQETNEHPVPISQIEW